MKNKTSLRFLINFSKKVMLSLVMVALLVIPRTSYAQTFNATLKIGVRGTEVTALQTLLAQDSTLYPQGLVTGYFGPLTKAAVVRFQARNGLSVDGIVGPRTRMALNSQVGGSITGAEAPAISNISVITNTNSATVSWGTNTLSKGSVYYSTTPFTLYEHENAVDVSGSVAMTDNNLRTSQSVTIQGLQPNTMYYYLIYTTGQNGIVSVTWPATFRTN